MARNLTLTAASFAEMLGVEESDLSPELRALIVKIGPRYEVLQGKERDDALLAAVKTLWDEKLPVTGRERQQAWERGWQEVLDRFCQSQAGVAALTPQYFRPFQTVRLGGRYLRPVDPDLELRLYTLFRHYVFERFLTRQDLKQIFEFGCGTAHNLVLLAGMCQGKRLIGLDWAAPSQELITQINRTLGLALEGRRFDFFNPDPGLEIPAGSALLTMNAMEQLGDNFQPFLEFCLQRRPDLCLHTEPLEELYDQEDIMDHLAWRYHHKRGYLKGFLSRLRELEALGRVEIFEVRRVKFGSQYHEGHSILAWRPL